MYEFDFKTLMLTLWSARRRILLNCGIALVAGVIIALSIPRTYVADCTLASESQEDDAGGLSSLASMAGINLSRSTDAIGPDLYPNVVSSRSFLVDLLYVEVQTQEGDRLSYYDYLRTRTRQPWWNWPFSALKQWMKSVLPSEKTQRLPGQRIDPEHMSREEELLVEGLKGAVGCRVNELDYTISLTVGAQDPNVAKQMVDTVMVHLQDFITAYRTSKARTDLRYYQQLEAETNQKFLQAQRDYAAYCDTHQGLILQAYQTEQERLENELQIALAAYTQMKQQVQMAEAKVQEKTPAFTLIEKSTVPTRPATPKRMLMVLAFMLLTFLGTCGWLYVKLLFFTKQEPTA